MFSRGWVAYRWRFIRDRQLRMVLTDPKTQRSTENLPSLGAESGLFRVTRWSGVPLCTRLSSKKGSQMYCRPNNPLGRASHTPIQNGNSARRRPNFLCSAWPPLHLEMATSIARHPMQGTFTKIMCPRALKPQLCRSFVSPTSNATAALARHRQNFDQTKHTGVCATSRSGTWRCSTKLLPTRPGRRARRLWLLGSAQFPGRGLGGCCRLRS